MSELRESLEDMSSFKEKELASALEKARGEITAGLDKQIADERRKLESDFERLV